MIPPVLYMVCHFTRDQCRRWLSQPDRNPVSNGPVTEGTPTYYRLLYACEVHGLEAPYPASSMWSDPSFMGCKKWMNVKSIAEEAFGVSSLVCCKRCNILCDPYAVHNPGSLDYECPTCKESVDIVYYCCNCMPANKPAIKREHRSIRGSGGKRYRYIN